MAKKERIKQTLYCLVPTGNGYTYVHPLKLARIMERRKK
jgi:hypothetical protein